MPHRPKGFFFLLIWIVIEFTLGRGFLKAELVNSKLSWRIGELVAILELMNISIAFKLLWITRVHAVLV